MTTTAPARSEIERIWRSPRFMGGIIGTAGESRGRGLRSRGRPGTRLDLDECVQSLDRECAAFAKGVVEEVPGSQAVLRLRFQKNDNEVSQLLVGANQN